MAVAAHRWAPGGDERVAREDDALGDAAAQVRRVETVAKVETSGSVLDVEDVEAAPVGRSTPDILEQIGHCGPVP